MKDLVGKKVGNYLLERVLGRGSSGVVYLGRHPLIDREVAVKVLDRPPGGDDSERFIIEARAAVQTFWDAHRRQKLTDQRPSAAAMPRNRTPRPLRPR